MLTCNPVSWYWKIWLTEIYETLFSSSPVATGREFTHARTYAPGAQLCSSVASIKQCTARQRRAFIGAFARVLRVAPAAGEASLAAAGRPITLRTRKLFLVSRLTLRSLMLPACGPLYLYLSACREADEYSAPKSSRCSYWHSTCLPP